MARLNLSSAWGTTYLGIGIAVETILEMSDVRAWLADAYFYKTQGLIGQNKVELAQQTLTQADQIAENLQVRRIQWQILISMFELEAQLGYEAQYLELRQEARAVQVYVVEHIPDSELRNSIALGAALPLDDRFGGFGVDGMYTADLPSDAILHSRFPWPIVESEDGYLLVAVMRNQDFVLMRFHPDGRLDASFNAEPSDFDGQRDAPYAITIQNDGKIIVAGVAKVGGNEDFALARYHPDGRLDHAFDNNGKVTTGFGLGGLNSEGVNAVAV